MLIRIEPTDSRPIYLQIMDEVRRAIVLELAEPDQALPSVRQLAADLRVNPNTVQQAYRELERESVVYTRRGRGTFVAAAPEESDTSRRQLARRVAARALTEAYRNGLAVDELVAAIRRAAESAHTGGSHNEGEER